MENYMPQVVSFRPDGANYFRTKRFVFVKNIIDEILKVNNSCRILDIGGTPAYWGVLGRELDWGRIRVVVANLGATPSGLPGLECVTGDARQLDQFSDLSFDFVHSNSVIEHVGRWSDMEAMAKEVRRLAPRYLVQTPYFWFPIEPHARFPFFHWMPESWRYRILMTRTCGFWGRQPDLGRAVAAIQSANILDMQQMRYLFPDAKMIFERYYGFPKSIMAIR